jgi:hypothetical protein
MDFRACSRAAATFVRGGTLPLCRKYRAYEATLVAIKEYMAWTTMTKDVEVFVHNCLH